MAERTGMRDLAGDQDRSAWISQAFRYGQGFFERMFSILRVLPITWTLADNAIALRQRRKLSLGDSLITATALEWRCPLATRNTDDFLWIDGPEVINPLAGVV
jgi:predicted nucleic acid-binding protein